MKRILLIEDMELYYELLAEVLCGRVEILWADNLTHGSDLFRENSDVDAIVMDACVPGDHPNSMPLIRDIIDAGYKKPIIACSSMPSYTDDLIQAGATHRSDKDKVGEYVLELLGLEME